MPQNPPMFSIGEVADVTAWPDTFALNLTTALNAAPTVNPVQISCKPPKMTKLTDQ